MIMNQDPNLEGFSKNALKLINLPSNRMAAAHFTGYMNDPYDKETNPNGYISLGIAENLLSIDILREKLEHPTFKCSMIQYSEFGGSTKLKELIANLQMTRVIKNPNLSYPIEAKHVSIGAGVTPIVENIFSAFCNPGEICIIPSPFYSAFVFDAFARANVTVVPAPMEMYNDNGDIQKFSIQLDVYDNLYKQYGDKIKLIVICNPNNPTGHIIPSHEILDLIQWAKSKNIHLISDEIYALSIFTEKANQDFHSIYDIVNGNLGNNIHIISGFSKDFCMNGYRCGYAISHNPNLTQYLNMTSQFYLCSNAAQSVITSILDDKEFLDRYIKSNQNALKKQYDLTTSLLDQHNIPYLPSDSGMFFTLDLRKCLESQNVASENKIWDQLYDEYKVILSTGKGCSFEKVGYYRLIFTIKEDSIREAINRISKYYQKYCKH
ncbi:1-aminocyclopropane-1-carboxylate synthase [Tieghemostelium lacteum]|uniref:1-aminocyclopropane-1-carboxylate synthase n=1 Tax=Tieghemostelium lacteum TaxID=361077 RepID=A0A152A1A3_TIELA|nr:1-aminocyclopropane-1-carboxylate synthase [Tieghemostelium lacteum]|eukprot:KYQ99850.1 1-aminocyclopropane-1-carboxylate synthase [Tieghemostelium lacteum]